MGDEKPGGERQAAMEAILEKHVLPMLQRMDRKLDELMESRASKESVKEAHDEIDALKVALEKKADKSEVAAVKEKVWMWSGGIAVLVMILGWLVPVFFKMLVS